MTTSECSRDSDVAHDHLGRLELAADGLVTHRKLTQRRAEVEGAGVQALISGMSVQ